jgi:hemoglobin
MIIEYIKKWNYKNGVYSAFANDNKSLYDRLGGIFAISMVVNRFSDQMKFNPTVGINSPNPYLRDWWINKSETRLPGLKWMRTLWVADVSGGPYKYVPTKSINGNASLNLETAHCPLHITSLDFDEAANELAKALDYYKVPNKEKMEVLSAFSGHKKEVIMGANIKVCPFA